MKSIRFVSMIAATALAITGCASLKEGTPVKGPGPRSAITKPAEPSVVDAKMLEAMPVEPKPVVGSGNPVFVKADLKGELRRGEIYSIEEPNGIGWSRSGELYVSDRTGLQFFDKKGKYIRRIDYPIGSSVPSGTIVDLDGNYLIPFYAEELIRKIDDRGKLLWAAKYPSIPGKTNNPNYIVPDIEKNTYWITDGARFQLIKGVRNNAEFKVEKVVGRVSGTYSFQTKEIDDLPALGKAVRNPVDGNLWGLTGPEIKVIDPKSGKVIKTLGGKGMSIGRFQGIGDVVFLKNGHYLVLDVMLNVVKEFDKDSGYICTYVSNIENGKQKLDTNYPSSLAFDEGTRTAYIASAVLNKVFIFSFPQPPAAAK